jgi:multisubunit Na+/H+ antiporter MnhB subunit
MTIEFLILLLIGFMLISALIAVEAKDLLSSVIALGAAGSALCVIDLLLGAPDLAFPEVVVEVITVVLLIRMVLRRDDTSRQTARDTLRTGLVLLCGGLLLVAVFLAFGGAGRGGAVPAFGQPVLTNATDAATPPGVSAEYLQKHMQDTGVANAVMAVFLGYRGYDALAAVSVIFVAILGVYVVLRRVGRKEKQEQTP